MIIKTCSKLTKDEYKKILALQTKCENFDNTETIMFLEEELNYDSSFECYYMAMEEGQIVSFVSVFVPGDGTGEIYGLTDPDFRRQGHFKELVKIISEKLETLGIPEIYLVCSSSSKISKKIIYEKKLKIAYSEYLLEHIKGHKEETDAGLELIVSKEDENTYYFETRLDSVHVGECMIELNDMACIYDFNVAESLRGRGLGSKTLVCIVNYITDNLTDEIVLQLHGDNKSAANMYFHHGFAQKSRLDYVRLYL